MVRPPRRCARCVKAPPTRPPTSSAAPSKANACGGGQRGGRVHGACAGVPSCASLPAPAGAALPPVGGAPSLHRGVATMVRHVWASSSPHGVAWGRMRSHGIA
eukprot:6965172-Prymnesium_polylepis.1